MLNFLDFLSLAFASAPKSVRMHTRAEVGTDVIRAAPLAQELTKRRANMDITSGDAQRLIDNHTSMAPGRCRGLVRRATTIVAISLLLSLLTITNAQAMSVAKDVPDLVAESEWIAQAELVSAKSRWNTQHTLIVTDYHFRSVRVLAGAPPGISFTLTQAGGIVGNLGDEVSDAARLEVGNSYLLFAPPEFEKQFVPFVGGAQGVFLLQPSGLATSLGGRLSPVDAPELFAEVNELIAQRGSAPARVPFNDYVPSVPYPTKEYLPIGQTQPISGTTREPVAAEVTAPDHPDSKTQSYPSESPSEVSQSPGSTPNSVFPRKIAPPAIFNPLRSGDAPFAPVDQHMMAVWNEYGGNIFRVYDPPIPTWAWQNDRFDVAGFVPNATMILQFNSPWGSSELAKTFTRWIISTNIIIESDIAFNPAACWTLDEALGQNPADSCWSFRQVMLHELGHAWGLAHPWDTQDVWWDSVMNYFPKPYNTSLLRADDTNALQAAFGSRPARSDAMVSLYTTSSRGVGQSPLYTPTPPGLKNVKHGDDLSLGHNQFTLENIGTTDILSPQVAFHLAPRRLSTTGRIQLGTATYPTIPVYNIHKRSLPTLSIPSATPTGEYYLAGQLTAADYNAGNNWSWATQIVRVKNVARVLDMRTNIQLTGIGRIGPKGIWTFEFDAVAGQTYGFSLCGSEGGSATFDSKLSIYDGSTLKASNDDACGLQSRLMYKASTTRRHSVVVGSYADMGQGTFKLAYWRDDTIFRHGFEN